MNSKEFKAKKQKEFRICLNSIPKTNSTVSEKKAIGMNVKSMIPPTFTAIRSNNKLENLSDFVVIDIETNGLKVTDKILEIAAIKFVNFQPIEAFHTYINPKCALSEEASKINGITANMLQDAPDIKNVIPALDDFIGGFNIVCQNAAFDLKFLYKNGYNFHNHKRNYYDTLILAQKHIKINSNSEISDRRLESLCEYFNIYPDNFHDALTDCFATGLVFEGFIEEILVSNVLFQVPSIGMTELTEEIIHEYTPQANVVENNIRAAHDVSTAPNAPNPKKPLSKGRLAGIISLLAFVLLSLAAGAFGFTIIGIAAAWILYAKRK